MGHPTADRWLPLAYKEGMKTDTIHICPNKKQNGSLLAVVTTTAAAATPSKLDQDKSSHDKGNRCRIE